MIKFLIHFVQRKKPAEQQRAALSNLSGIAGIICNLFLSAAKFITGHLTGSVSVTADAVNNLSDSIVNIVTVTGTRLSQKPDDKEHPFGHGRIEYISALLIAFSIFVVSFELGKSSVMKILHPEEISFKPWYLVILALSILVKLWMAFLNGRLYRLTDNPNLKAVRQDSLNDCLATGAVMLSLILSHAFGFQRIDGIMGVAVSVFILWSGIDILKKVVSPLLGEPPSREVTERIQDLILDNDIVLGVHDLVIHNYGASRILASADAEVDAQASVFEIHEAIDQAEHRIQEELGILICIHMDPVDPKDRKALKLRKTAEKIISRYNSSFSFHDLKDTQVEGRREISLDVQVPVESMAEQEKIQGDLEARFRERFPNADIHIRIEHALV